jgi:hypothetical protein
MAATLARKEASGHLPGGHFSVARWPYRGAADGFAYALPALSTTRETEGAA